MALVPFCLLVAVVWTLVGLSLWVVDVREVFVWYAALFVSFLTVTELATGTEAVSPPNRTTELAVVGFIGWFAVLVGYVRGVL